MSSTAPHPADTSQPRTPADADNPLTIAVQHFGLLDAARIATLQAAHPRCDVRVAATPEEFAALVATADAAFGLGLLAENLRRFAEGEPLHGLVHKDAGYQQTVGGPAALIRALI